MHVSLVVALTHYRFESFEYGSFDIANFTDTLLLSLNDIAALFLLKDCFCKFLLIYPIEVLFAKVILFLVQFPQMHNLSFLL